MQKMGAKRKFVAQSFQLFSLLSYLVLLIYVFREERSLELMSLVFGFGLIFDQIVHFFFRKKLRNPIPSLITSCAVLILMTTHFNYWPYLLALTIGLTSKYLIRTENRHIFNPACFGLFFVVLVFSEQSQIKFSQWLPNSSQYLLLIALGFAVVTIAGRLWIGVAYFSSILLLTSLYGVANPDLPFQFLIGTLFSFSVTLFAFHMITDPATTPTGFTHQIYFGSAVGTLDFLIRRLEEPYAPFYALLFISALWNLKDPLKIYLRPLGNFSKIASLVLLVFYFEPAGATDICSRNKHLLKVLNPRDCTSFELKIVTRLDLSGLSLKQLADVDLSGFDRLVYLNLSQNNLKSLPENIKGLKKLQVLDLSNNLFVEYPTQINELPTLKRLDLSYNWFEKIEKLSGNKLEEVNLFHNNLKMFPKGLTNLKKLITLNLGFNYIEELPESVSNWKDLRVLVFNYNKLKELPTGIKYWKKLKFVDFHRNLLTSVPKAIGNWKNIETVNFSENRLKKVPDSVASWRNVRFANFSNNQITYLGKSLKGWSKIIEVNFSNNQIESLPKEIGSWKDLRFIKLNYNRITNLPDLKHWMNIMEFSIHHNRLSKMPQSIGEWTQIRKVEIYNNFLEELPGSVGNWRNLKEIDLRYNQITQLPKESKRWYMLEKLQIAGNPTIKLPKGLPPNSVIY